MLAPLRSTGPSRLRVRYLLCPQTVQPAAPWDWRLSEVLETTLPPQTVSARDARRFVTTALHSLGHDVHAEVAALLVSELVTNAILHARSEIVLRVRDVDQRVRVEVGDASLAALVVRDFGREASTGRGLMLVESIADRWGSEVSPGGKTVWFELAEAV